MRPFIKICGVTTLADIDAAAKAGATHVGFLFISGKPNSISPYEASEHSQHVPSTLSRVAVVVDAGDDLIDKITKAIKPDMWQFHGKETPARVIEVARATGNRVIKAFEVHSRDDIGRASDYEAAADMLLFDKPKALPGGEPKQQWQDPTFFRSQFAGVKFSKKWILAGGLLPETVSDAIKLLTPNGVDVSSGVESAPGVKSPQLIEDFCRSARSAFTVLSRHDN